MQETAADFYSTSSASRENSSIGLPPQLQLLLPKVMDFIQFQFTPDESQTSILTINQHLFHALFTLF